MTVPKFENIQVFGSWSVMFSVSPSALNAFSMTSSIGMITISDAIQASMFFRKICVNLFFVVYTIAFSLRHSTTSSFVRILTMKNPMITMKMKSTELIVVPSA